MDLISRQAAIETAENVAFAVDEHGSAEGWLAMLTNSLEILPSAQPEPCEDAVSRRILLSDLKELTAAWGKYPVMAEQIKGVEAAIGYVETIPSVTPEQKKGKWIKRYTGTIANGLYCSVCGRHGYGSAFCENCGADMR